MSDSDSQNSQPRGMIGPVTSPSSRPAEFACGRYDNRPLLVQTDPLLLVVYHDDR